MSSTADCGPKRLQYPTQHYALSAKGSRDGRIWRKLTTLDRAIESPIELTHAANVRYMRLTVPKGAGVWEWTLH